MEGKEARFGIVNSAIWATATTAASNGSVNSMHDSYMPLGGLIPMWLMQLGEVIFGGVGSGLYGMIAFVIIAVFISGLMIGRTPEYLGKKIEAYEMKMASLMILIPPILVLIGNSGCRLFCRRQRRQFLIPDLMVSAKSCMLFLRQEIIMEARLLDYPRILFFTILPWDWPCFLPDTGLPYRYLRLPVRFPGKKLFR